MKRVLMVSRWVQFIGWCALWLWSALTDDQNQPWRVMFSIACMVNALSQAFKQEPPKEVTPDE